MFKNTLIHRYIFILFILFALPFLSFATPMSFNILDYGAKGDGAILIKTFSF